MYTYIHTYVRTYVHTYAYVYVYMCAPRKDGGGASLGFMPAYTITYYINTNTNTYTILYYIMLHYDNYNTI